MLGDGATASVVEGGTFVLYAQLDRPSSEETRVMFSVEAVGPVAYEVLPHRYLGLDESTDEGVPGDAYTIYGGYTSPSPDER